MGHTQPQDRNPEAEHGPERRRLKLAILALVACLLSLTVTSFALTGNGNRVIRISLDSIGSVGSAFRTGIAPQTYKPITKEDAAAENARRPLDKRPLEIAFPLIYPMTTTNQSGWEKAVQCLTLANYYEAANEGIAGMRAVSQVILNRVRHPSFPKSVCEVVFQGSERATGCQFTFTCDGSLNRSPMPALFAQARSVAIAALQGSVDAAVGMATHYHANYVVPYWADEMDKVRTLGLHIFYVWKGSAGNRSAFRGNYVGESSVPGQDPIPAIATIGMPMPDAAGLAVNNGLLQDSLLPPDAAIINHTRVAADEGLGSLVADETRGSLDTPVQALDAGERNSP